MTTSLQNKIVSTEGKVFGISSKGVVYGGDDFFVTHPEETAERYAEFHHPSLSHSQKVITH